MSYRTLIEINHDRFGDADCGFVSAVERYVASASRESAEALERYGVKVIGMRHHSHNFILDGDAEGFPVRYLTRIARPKDDTAERSTEPRETRK